MQIHELPAQTTAEDADVVAIDNGTTTQKMTVANLGKKITEDAAPAFTSGDSSEATSWTNVAAVTSGLPMKNILSRITTMMKNVRYLYNMLGTTDITGSGKNTVSGAIGGTSISDIGDGTLTGAISILNTDFASLFDESKATALSVYENRIDNNHLFYYYIGDLCFVYGLFRITEPSPWADMALATGLRTPAWNTIIPICGVNNTTHDAVILHVNAVGSLCLRTVVAQYTWVSVFGLYRSN